MQRSLARCFAKMGKEKMNLDRKGLQKECHANAKKWVDLFLEAGLRTDIRNRCVCLLNRRCLVIFEARVSWWVPMFVTGCKATARLRWISCSGT